MVSAVEMGNFLASGDDFLASGDDFPLKVKGQVMVELWTPSETEINGFYSQV